MVTLEIPALRHRREDIPLLIEHFLAKSKERHVRSPAVRLAPDALAKVMAHSWPGNVRELEHVIERAVILARDASIGAADLPASLGAPSTAPPDFGGEVVPMREMQRRYAHWAYERLGGRKVLTAETLALDFKTLSKLLGPSDESD